MTPGSRHHRTTLPLLWALAASCGCGSVAAAEPTASDDAVPRALLRGQPASIVLITLDGARWQEVFHGVDVPLADVQGLAARERLTAQRLMPNLHHLISHDGAALGANPDGASMHASGPNFVSLPGYIELLTGRTRTDCDGNQCGRARSATLFDDLAANGCQSAAVFSSWSGLASAVSMREHSTRSSVGKFMGEHRSELAVSSEIAAELAAGEHATTGPGEDDFRPDAYTGAAALSYLQAAHPRALLVGLGDTDEYAHANDYRAYLSALHRADALIGRIAAVMRSEIASGHPTTLFITTDHGRADSFAHHGAKYAESSRVWLVAAGSGIAARGLVSSNRTRHLADVAPTIRQLIGLPAAHTRDSGEVLTELLSTRPPTAPSTSSATSWLLADGI